MIEENDNDKTIFQILYHILYGIPYCVYTNVSNFYLRLKT